MATESIGRTVHLNDEQFEQIVNEMERINANPPRPRKTSIQWGDPDQFMRDLGKKYATGK